MHGVVRKTDTLGRLVIPKEIRKNNHIDVGDSIEFFVDRDRIVLIKHIASLPSCAVCNNNFENLKIVKESSVCNKCIGEIKRL